MGRSPCCDEEGLKKGPWTPEEDQKLVDYIQKHGHGSWRALPRHAGLNRCGKSCRLRWTNYLRPDIKRGKFSEEEERLIIHLHSAIGNKWSAMAARLHGRTDNEIKNYWNTHLKKKLLGMGIDPVTHRPRADLNLLANLPGLLAAANLGNLSSNPWDSAIRMQADAAQLARIQLLQTLVQAITANSNPNVDLVNLMGAAMLRNYQSGDLLQPNNRPFQGLLDGAISLGQGTAPSLPGLPSHGLPPVPGDVQLPSQSCLTVGVSGLVSQGDHVSSPKALGVDSSGVGVIQMSSSSNNPTAASTPSVASPAPEDITLDQFRDMISSSNVSPNSSTASFETWAVFADADNDPCWNDILECSQTPLQTWPMTP